jgi:hypothetical protein
LRASFSARQRGVPSAGRDAGRGLVVDDRLNHASERATKRAECTRRSPTPSGPYASLNDEQRPLPQSC